MAENNMWYDEVGRIYCDAHKREVCHECCYDFSLSNRHIEIDKGLRKPPTEIETLAEQQTILLKGIQYMRDKKQSEKDPNMVFHLKELKKVNKRLEELKAAGNAGAIAQAINDARLKDRAHDADLEAITSAWAKANPGKRNMEYGGAETQKLFEQVAAPPPSAAAAANRRDNLLCGYCGKSSAEKLLFCARCRGVSYCNKECQTAAWKGHKPFCRRVERAATTAEGTATAAPSDERLPLTWEQLEAFGPGVPATERVLELRVMLDISVMRQVFECKDRVGAVRTVAAYTDSRSIVGLAPGKVLRIKNPRFHYFADGRTGARVEQEDLVNVTVFNT